MLHYSQIFNFIQPSLSRKNLFYNFWLILLMKLKQNANLPTFHDKKNMKLMSMINHFNIGLFFFKEYIESKKLNGVLWNKQAISKYLPSSLISLESEHLFSVAEVQYIDCSSNSGADNREDDCFCPIIVKKFNH